jgi:outer membrane protein TolC
MMRIKEVIIYTQTLVCLGILLFCAPYSWATECRLENLSDYFQRIASDGPQVELLKLQEQSFLTNVERSAQRPNPILNITNSYDGNNKQENYSLQYVWELGSKRKARVEHSQAQLDGHRVQADISKERIEKSIFLELYQLLYYQRLESLYRESLRQFTQFKKRLKRSNSLSPEEKITLYLLDVEIDKHQIFIGQVQNDMEASYTLLKKVLSAERCDLKLPGLAFTFLSPDDLLYGPLQSYAMRVVEKDLLTAQSVSKLESSKAYPNINIGPNFMTDQFGEDSFQLWGISLTMNLPLLQSNQAGVRWAKSYEQLLLKKRSIVEKQESLQLNLQLKQYRNNFKKMQKISSHALLEKRHHVLDDLFAAGRVSISTIREAHDQIISLIQMRHALERDSLTLLFDIYEAQNKQSRLYQDLGIPVGHTYE